MPAPPPCALLLPILTDTPASKSYTVSSLPSLMDPSAGVIHPPNLKRSDSEDCFGISGEIRRDSKHGLWYQPLGKNQRCSNTFNSEYVYGTSQDVKKNVSVKGLGGESTLQSSSHNDTLRARMSGHTALSRKT